MSIAEMHPEDIRAALRKRFGTITKFEQEYKLPKKSVYEIFRGRKSARVSRAIENAIIETPIENTEKEYTTADSKAHRTNAGAQ